jgi:hypothetical protein
VMPSTPGSTQKTRLVRVFCFSGFVPLHAPRESLASDHKGRQD